MEDPKNIKDDKKEKESPELKEELAEEELSALSGGMPSKFTTKDLTDEELKGVSGGAVEFRDMSNGDVLLGEDARPAPDKMKS